MSNSGLLSSEDLFFTTRILDTARALGFPMQLLTQPEQIRSALANPPLRLWILDLDTSESLLELVSSLGESFPQVRVIAFGSHVETARLKAARAAGCQLVVPRSKFTTDLVSYLEEAKST